MESVIAAGSSQIKMRWVCSDTGHMSMAQVLAVTTVAVGKRVRINGQLLVFIDLVGELVNVRMRLFCHIPRAFGAHKEHGDDKDLANY